MARILLAEDDPDIAMLVQFKLEQAGHEVEHAADGRAAIEAYEANPADLAVLDVMMPRVDGLEVTRILAGKDPRPRILVLTAKGREDDVEAGFDAGADDYLTKPFSPRELASRVERLLRA